MLGSAIGFLVILCISAPDMPRAPPANIPNTVLGTLCSITVASMLSESLPKRTSMTFEKAICFAPKDIEKIAIIKSKAKHKTI